VVAASGSGRHREQVARSRNGPRHVAAQVLRPSDDTVGHAWDACLASLAPDGDRGGGARRVNGSPARSPWFPRRDGRHDDGGMTTNRRRREVDRPPSHATSRGRVLGGRACPPPPPGTTRHSAVVTVLVVRSPRYTGGMPWRRSAKWRSLRRARSMRTISSRRSSRGSMMASMTSSDARRSRSTSVS